MYIPASCEGQFCFCGKPAVRKVGEEIMRDDPYPVRHNLTSYICGDHYIQLMGPAAARQLERTSNDDA